MTLSRMCVTPWCCEALEKGLYGELMMGETCASCHGSRGLGNGQAGSDLSPPPTNLAAMLAMPRMRCDPYLYWAIAEGSAAIGTAMPAFKDTLSADDIWSLVHFL